MGPGPRPPWRKLAKTVHWPVHTWSSQRPATCFAGLELAERIESLEANLARDDLLTLEIELVPFEPLADRAWELRHNLTIYDGWYVALAETLSCPLLTLDQRLARATGPTCRIITPAPLRVVRERAATRPLR